jgi:hypothetical protein
MAREHQLQGAVAQGGESRRLGFHLHALGRRGGARGGIAAHALDLDDAHAAGTVGVEVLVVADGGNMDAGGARGLENGLACLDLDRAAVNGQTDAAHAISLGVNRLPMGVPHAWSS